MILKRTTASIESNIQTEAVTKFYQDEHTEKLNKEVWLIKTNLQRKNPWFQWLFCVTDFKLVDHAPHSLDFPIIYSTTGKIGLETVSQW